MKNILKLIRVKQWVKNGFIIFPLIFSGRLFQLQSVEDVIATFVGFCFLASGLYVFNDFLDLKADAVHPEKSSRPLGRMRLHPFQIGMIIVGLMAAGLVLCSLVGPLVFFVGVTYILVHLVYNFYTKKLVILDVIFIALGFQVRIWAGSFAAGVFPSVWLQMCVFVLALFLGFIKRRHELTKLKDRASEHRSVLAHYTSYLLDQIIMICATLTIVFYGLYAISPEIALRFKGHGMVYSIIFVLYGLFRYIYLVHVKRLGGDPGEVIMSDMPLMISIFLWMTYIILLTVHAFH
jgi:4-hydroxybenzoate polyprenyltransferase